MEHTTLVTQARDGDRAAFGRLVRQFQDMAFASAYGWLGDVHLAQDAAQDAFLEAWQSLPRLREPAAFPGWFRRIVRKHADRHQRSRRPVVSDRALETVAAPLPDPLEITEHGQVRDSVHSAIAALPETQRLPLTLFHLDGYSQKEVAAFLELPVSTVKKRIFDARRALQERMSYMVKETLDEARPSRDDGFARKVEYFAAVRDRDVDAVATLLDTDPSLLTLKSDWDIAPDDLIPRNITAARWAAMMNDVPLLTLLLDRGLDVTTPDGERDIVREAVMALGHDALRLLLERGANVEEGAGFQTPLHRAVMRDDRIAVDILLDAGADLEAKDHRGRTPADWAAMKGREELLEYLETRGAQPASEMVRSTRLRVVPPPGRAITGGDAVLGRILDASGNAIDGRTSGTPESVPGSIDSPPSQVLETGIKVIDLFAPIRRAGHVALSAGLGVGKAVVTTQIARNVVAELGGRIVFVASPHEAPQLAFREWFSMLADGRQLGEATAFVVARPDDVADQQTAVETGVGLADRFRREGHEALLVIDSRVARAPGVLSYLRGSLSAGPEAAVTTLYLGHGPDGMEEEVFAFLDASIRMDGRRVSLGLYPAVDPVLSGSRLLSDGTLGEDHLRTVDRCRILLRRYQGHGHSSRLGDPVQLPKRASMWGSDTGAYDELVTEISRARRLDQFLTQPFHSTEIWMGEPGEAMPLVQTLSGCNRILDGEFDHLPEEAFHMVGTVEQAVEKAKRL